MMTKLMPTAASLTILAALLTSAVSACGTAPPEGRVQITAPGSGEELWGIVKLTAVSSDDDALSITFYWDFVDEAHRIAAGEFYTQDVPNGEHTLYAVAAAAPGRTLQDTIRVKVANVSRAEAVPPGAVKMAPALDQHPPRLEPAFRAVWEDPVPLGPPINSAGGEDSPFIPRDSDDFYFWFTPDVNIAPQNQVFDRVTGIYRSRWVNGDWAEPARVFLTYYDEPSLDGAHTVWDGELWFGSARAGNYRELDMWIARLRDGKWADWQNAGEKLNREYEIGELHITNDGTQIYFDSSRPGGKGGKDIWVTQKVNGDWQEPEPVTAVNTADSEGWPFLTEDGKELWFTRIRGAPEIWRSVKLGDRWQAPEKVLSPLAGEPTMDREGNLYFVHHYWDDAAARMIEADIYVCRRR